MVKLVDALDSKSSSARSVGSSPTLGTILKYINHYGYVRRLCSNHTSVLQYGKNLEHQREMAEEC